MVSQCNTVSREEHRLAIATGNRIAAPSITPRKPNEVACYVALALVESYPPSQTSDSMSLTIVRARQYNGKCVHTMEHRFTTRKGSRSCSHGCLLIGSARKCHAGSFFVYERWRFVCPMTTSAKSERVTNVFESILKHGHDAGFAPHADSGFTPTNAPAGSKDKVELLRRRVEQGQPLWHTEDRCDCSGLTGFIRRRA
jgi:hypothetical protein